MKRRQCSFSGKITSVCFSILTAIAVALPGMSRAQQSVDFSKSFVDSAGSGLGKIRVGGISVTGSPAIYSVDLSLRPDYSLGLAGGTLLTSVQDTLEQSLRNSTWTGTYDVNAKQFSTTLTIFAAQAGYVGGEITHQETSNRSGFLKARLAGEVVRQYTISGVLQDEDNLTAAQVAALGTTAPTSYVIRIKRVRGVSYVSDSSGNPWSTNREYRLSLKGTTLSGTVSIPSDNFGFPSANPDTGTITLTRK